MGVSPRRALSHTPRRAQDLFAFVCGSCGYLALKKKKKATVTVTMHNTGTTSEQHVAEDKDVDKGVRERKMTAMRELVTRKPGRQMEGGGGQLDNDIRTKNKLHKQKKEEAEMG